MQQMLDRLGGKLKRREDRKRKKESVEVFHWTVPFGVG
jgi:hypothetical protein